MHLSRAWTVVSNLPRGHGPAFGATDLLMSLQVPLAWDLRALSQVLWHRGGGNNLARMGVALNIGTASGNSALALTSQV